MSKVDDHGLFDARPSILRAALYPLKLDRVREADISRWLAECQRAGLIVLYEAGGKQYGKMLNTQWIVRSEPKFPAPSKEVLKALENTCAQVRPLSLSLSLSESLSFVGDVVVDDIVGASPTPRKAKPGKEQKHPTPEGYQPFVDHALASYRARKGVGMQFGAKEGKIVKGLLSVYSLHQLKALWDMFISQSWDWTDKNGKRVKLGHDLPGFWEKARILVGEPEFKTLAAKYEKDVPVNVEGMAQVKRLVEKIVSKS